MAEWEEAISANKNSKLEGKQDPKAPIGKIEEIGEDETALSRAAWQNEIRARMKNAACARCLFWDGPETEPRIQVGAGYRFAEGECRRTPPHPECKWPDARSDDWCGEFVPRRASR